MHLFDYLSIFSYCMAAFGYTMTNMLWLRVIMTMRCVLDAMIYFFIRPGNPLWVQVIMNVVIILINGIAIYKLIKDRYPPQLFGEIGQIYNTYFSQLSPSEFKALLAIGEWKTIGPDVILIHAGETNINPMIVTYGKVLIEQNGVVLTSLKHGALLGEINFLTNIPPKNNVITTEETRLFVMPRDKLNQLINKSHTIKAVINGSFGCHIAGKLKQMNEEISLGQ